MFQLWRQDHNEAVRTLYWFGAQFGKEQRLLKIALYYEYVDPQFFKLPRKHMTACVREGKHPLIQELLDQASRIPNDFGGFVDLSSPWEIETVTWEELSELACLVTTKVYYNITRDLIVDGILFSLDLTPREYTVKQNKMQQMGSERFITPSWIRKHLSLIHI